MNEETQGQMLDSTLEDGAKYVAEYFKKARGIEYREEEIRSILEIYLDYLLLINITEVPNE